MTEGGVSLDQDNRKTMWGIGVMVVGESIAYWWEVVRICGLARVGLKCVISALGYVYVIRAHKQQRGLVLHLGRFGTLSTTTPF